MKRSLVAIACCIAFAGPSSASTLAWAVGALLVFTYPAIRGYRRAAAAR